MYDYTLLCCVYTFVARKGGGKMAKKFLCVVMTVVFLLSSVIVAPATADDTTALGNGFTNVIFSNEYRGFCLDRYKSGAYIGDVFTPTETSKATNNINNGDILIDDVQHAVTDERGWPILFIGKTKRFRGRI